MASTPSPSVRTGVSITLLSAIFFLIIALFGIPQYFSGSSTASNQIVQSSVTLTGSRHSDDHSAPRNDGEPYHDPEPFCNSTRDSGMQFRNHFPVDLSVEEIIIKRSQPARDIPMCPGSDAANYDQHRDLIAKLPPNYVRYTNRCQIKTVGRNRRQFGGLPSGDPILSNLSTQIAFLHIYKSGE